jgi:AraC-like DNA-binding protein
MTEAAEIKRPNILLSCYTHKSSEGEQFVAEHTFGYIIAGRTDSFVGNQSYQFKAGDFRVLRRNQLTKYTKFPEEGGEYRSISVTMDQDTLRGISEEYNLRATSPHTGECAILLQPCNLLHNYVDSLKPYLNTHIGLNKSLTELKVKEIVLLLVEIHPTLKNVLFDFSEPGKIDLEAYMNSHYKYNVDLNKFAYLTGRSLATFKRDFEKIYNTSPNKWLQQKRLDDAYYLITEKGWKSSDVYLEVGFKDLSHFSFAFKKAYGMAPSKAV